MSRTKLNRVYVVTYKDGGPIRYAPTFKGLYTSLGVAVAAVRTRYKHYKNGYTTDIIIKEFDLGEGVVVFDTTEEQEEK